MMSETPPGEAYAPEGQGTARDKPAPVRAITMPKYAAVQTMLNFATHPGAKTAKPETFIDNSILAEIGKSGFVDRLYK